MNRNHRIGQNNTCVYIALLADKTIDERIWRVLRQKGNLNEEMASYLREAHDA